jgi:hypothetical protein
MLLVSLQPTLRAKLRGIIAKYFSVLMYDDGVDSNICSLA